MGRALLGGTGLSGHAHRACVDGCEHRAVLHHALHAGVDCLPGGGGYALDGPCLPLLELFHHLAVHILHPVQEGQLIERALVGHGRDVAGQLAGGVVVGTLSHSGADGVLVGNLRVHLRYLQAAGLVKAKQLRVLRKPLQTVLAGVGPVSLHAKLVPDIIEELVTGVGDAADHIHRAMPCRVYPAVYLRADHIKITVTVHSRTRVDGPLCQARHRHKWLVGGTRSRRLLCRAVVEGLRGTGVQLIIVFAVHGVGQPVVVVSRVGDAGQHIPAVRVRDDHRASAGLQAQLPRRDLQGLYLAAQEIVGPGGT